MDIVKQYARQYRYFFFRDGGAAWNLYNINNGIPLNYVVDTAGIVRYGSTGFYESTIRAVIESYLPQVGIDENTQPVQMVENFSVTPNPASAKTNIRFNLAKAEHASVRVYASSGALVRTIFDGQLPAGINNMQWNLQDDAGRTVTNGIYIYEFVTGTSSARAKVTVLR
jgi:hypothetical protein